MVNPEQLRAVERDVDVIEDIRTRINGKGRLADLLLLTPVLEDIYQRRCAAHGWKSVADEQVMLTKLNALQQAVDEGTISAQAHMMQLIWLGIFTSYHQPANEALEVVKVYLMYR